MSLTPARTPAKTEKTFVLFLRKFQFFSVFSETLKCFFSFCRCSRRCWTHLNLRGVLSWNNCYICNNSHKILSNWMIKFRKCNLEKLWRLSRPRKWIQIQSLICLISRAKCEAHWHLGSLDLIQFQTRFEKKCSTNRTSRDFATFDTFLEAKIHAVPVYH